jgi:hypothetical protein
VWPHLHQSFSPVWTRALGRAPGFGETSLDVIEKVGFATRPVCRTCIAVSHPYGPAPLAGRRALQILGLQRRHVAADGTKVEVEQRVYRGEIDDPKTRPSLREVAVPPRTAALLREWLETADETSPDAFVFAGESGKPVWRDTLLSGETRCYMITSTRCYMITSGRSSSRSDWVGSISRS